LASSSNSATVETVDELLAYMASGCKPEDQWKLGTEHEKFGYTVDDLRPLPYSGKRSIHAVLSGLAEQFGWNHGRISGCSVAVWRHVGCAVVIL